MIRVEIKVEQKIVNGETSPKEYSLHISNGNSYYHNRSTLYNLSVEEIKEMIPKLQEELEKALKI